MDWSNERYVRVYTRDTDDWLVLSWDARALWLAMMRKFDRAGVLETKRGARGVAALVGAPLDVVERGLPELLTDGCVVEHPLGYAAPNFIEAQETPQSDKQRAKSSRERRRSTSVTDRDETITDRDDSVTFRDESSRGVTRRHAASRGVTPSQSGPDQPDQPELPRAIPGAPVHTYVPDLGARARGQLGDRTWSRLNEIRREISRERDWPDVLDLHPMDRGRRDLGDRIRESGDQAEQRCDHVLAVLEAEARRDGTVEWLSGKSFTEGGWQRACAMRVADVNRERAGPRAAGAVEPVNRNNPMNRTL